MKQKIKVGLALSAALFGIWLFATITAPGPTTYQPVGQAAPTPQPPLLDQINAVRAKVGKPALVEDEKLSEAAHDKTQDMINRNYQAHSLPNESPWQFLFKYYPRTYDHVAENLAWCQSSDSQRVEDWTNSPKHYEAMIGDFKYWGSSTVYNPKDKCNYTTNYFMQPSAKTVISSPNTVVATPKLVAPRPYIAPTMSLPKTSHCTTTWDVATQAMITNCTTY